MAELQKSTVKRVQAAEKPEGEARYLLPFVWMLLLTAASFVLVGTEIVPLVALIPIILVLAVIQVLMQLFTFMHLDQKGSRMLIIFTSGGCIVATTVIIAMLFWV